MGALLGSVLENIIMIVCKKVIVGNLVKERRMKFYVCYAYDTTIYY